MNIFYRNGTLLNLFWVEGVENPVPWHADAGVFHGVFRRVGEKGVDGVSSSFLGGGLGFTGFTGVGDGEWYILFFFSPQASALCAFLASCIAMESVTGVARALGTCTLQ